MAQPKTLSHAKKKEVDPEMLKNLELLMNYEVLELEADWDDIESMDSVSEDIPDKEFEDEA